MGGREAVRRSSAGPVERFRGPVLLRGRADRPGCLAAAPPRRLNSPKGHQDTSSPRGTSREPGDAPPRSRALGPAGLVGEKGDVAPAIPLLKAGTPAHEYRAVSQPLDTSGSALAALGSAAWSPTV